MKKLKIALLMIVAVVFILPSCKKGPDDPFISFRSRDGRLIRTWKLTNITGTYNNDAVTYDGANVTEAGTTNYINATFVMTFDKDAKFSYTETKTSNFTGAKATTTTDQSYWFWSNSNKNKDFLICNANLFGLGSGEYFVDGLKTSTLTLKYDDETSTSITNLTFTFTKQ